MLGPTSRVAVLTLAPSAFATLSLCSPEQKAAADAYIAEISPVYRDKIVTEVTAASTFFPAEDYHQNYFEKNPGQGYCRAVVAPKVKKATEKFAALLK